MRGTNKKRGGVWRLKTLRSLPKNFRKVRLSQLNAGRVDIRAKRPTVRQQSDDYDRCCQGCCRCCCAGKQRLVRNGPNSSYRCSFLVSKVRLNMVPTTLANHDKCTDRSVTWGEGTPSAWATRNKSKGRSLAPGTGPSKSRSRGHAAGGLGEEAVVVEPRAEVVQVGVVLVNGWAMVVGKGRAEGGGLNGTTHCHAFFAILSSWQHGPQLAQRMSPTVMYTKYHTYTLGFGFDQPITAYAHGVAGRARGCALG